MAEQVGFAADIRPLFTDVDIDHMSWFCDLAAYADVDEANCAIGMAITLGGLPADLVTLLSSDRQ